MFAILRNLHDNTTARTSFTALHQERLTGTSVAVITSGFDLRMVILAGPNVAAH
jgi:hypothetical protein